MAHGFMYSFLRMETSPIEWEIAAALDSGSSSFMKVNLEQILADFNDDNQVGRAQ